MSIVLPPDFEDFVQRQVTSGAYASQQEVLSTALDLLKRREQLLAHIDAGTDDLRAGRYSDYGPGDRARFLSDMAGAESKSAGDRPA